MLYSAQGKGGEPPNYVSRPSKGAPPPKEVLPCTPSRPPRIPASHRLRGGDLSSGAPPETGLIFICTPPRIPEHHRLRGGGDAQIPKHHRLGATSLFSGPLPFLSVAPSPVFHFRSATVNRRKIFPGTRGGEEKEPPSWLQEKSLSPNGSGGKTRIDQMKSSRPQRPPPPHHQPHRPRRPEPGEPSGEEARRRGGEGTPA